LKWLRKIFGGPSVKEPKGISLGENAKWVISGVQDQVIFFSNLKYIFPEPDYILFFEGIVIADDVKKYFDENSVPNPAEIAAGTLWPKPKTYHILLTNKSIEDLVSFSKQHASCEICDHFHVYKDNVIYLEWHDAWGKDPILCYRENENCTLSIRKSFLCHMAIEIILM